MRCQTQQPWSRRDGRCPQTRLPPWTQVSCCSAMARSQSTKLQDYMGPVPAHAAGVQMSSAELRVAAEQVLMCRGNRQPRAAPAASVPGTARACASGICCHEVGCSAARDTQRLLTQLICHDKPLPAGNKQHAAWLYGPTGSLPTLLSP